MNRFVSVFLIGLMISSGFAEQVSPFNFEKIDSCKEGRWTTEQAWNWYREVAPMIGCNYLPRTAVNTVEMWQKETFDPKTIDQELGWAHNAGYNTIRVFLQYVVWKADPEGMKERIETFLKIADSHKIRVMLIPFCDCSFSGKEPVLGKQPDPRPGVHNSGWVPSPGLKRVTETDEWPSLERYIKDIVGTFRKDRRVLAWDLYNEPGQSGLGEKSMPLVEASFRWARSVKPTQPLTAGVWTHFKNRMSIAQFELSDVISFHTYLQPKQIVDQIGICDQFKRPVICTEWLMRQHGNTFETVLPIFAEHQIGSYHWGLVVGRTQTNVHWESKPGDPEPELWQHDMLNSKGVLHRPNELLIQRKYGEQIRTQLGKNQKKPTIEASDFKGWEGYALQNGVVQLNVLPDVGGRVIRYALGDKNFLWINPAVAGKCSPVTGLDAKGEWMNYGGDKLWPAPQGWSSDEEWPGPPDGILDGQPHQAVVDKANASIHLTSRNDPHSGIRFSRKIHLYPRSSRVGFQATMTNVDKKDRRWGIWAHTQLDAGVPGSDDYNHVLRSWCPINPKSSFKNGYRVIFGPEDNPQFTVDKQRQLMCVNYKYLVSKLGLDSPNGWIATVDGRKGDVFVQHFVYEADRAYPDGSSVEFWTNGKGKIYAYNKWCIQPETPAENPYVLESEMISPFAQLKPGQSYTWNYDWYSCRIGGDYPVISCTSAGLVSQDLKVVAKKGTQIVQGRFGVFYEGDLFLEVYGKNGEKISRQLIRPNVSPRREVVLDDCIALPSSAQKICLVLESVQKEKIGNIAEQSL